MCMCGVCVRARVSVCTVNDDVVKSPTSAASSPDVENHLVMETKLTIIEILKVCLSDVCVSFSVMWLSVHLAAYLCTVVQILCTVFFCC